MIYPFTEHATVLEGSGTLFAGQGTITLPPGDGGFVEQGTVAWKV